MLDDSFTALDGTTETQVIGNLLGATGLFRKMGTTVLWVTNACAYFLFHSSSLLFEIFLIYCAAQYFHLADAFLIVDDSRVKKLVGQSSLSAERDEIAKIMLSDSKNLESISEQSISRLLQSQRRTDAAIDLNRKTGDFSLYGSLLFLRTLITLPHIF